MEEGLYSCGHIQTEKHVIEHCPRTAALREQYNITTIENLFMERKDYATVCTLLSATIVTLYCRYIPVAIFLRRLSFYIQPFYCVLG